jgi:ABC-type hemin transport system ATPase subunit
MLDEPSLGQDREYKIILMRILRSLAEAGRLVLMTTHDLVLAAAADRLVLLGSAGVIADGKPEWVLRDRLSWEKAGIFLPDWIFEAHLEGMDG